MPCSSPVHNKQVAAHGPTIISPSPLPVVQLQFCTDRYTPPRVITKHTMIALVVDSMLMVRLMWYPQDFVTLYQNFNEKGLALVAFPWSVALHPLLCFIPVPVTLACCGVHVFAPFGFHGFLQCQRC